MSGVLNWFCVRTRVGYCMCFEHDFNLNGIRIRVSICQGHQLQGLREMNEFSFVSNRVVVLGLGLVLFVRGPQHVWN